MTAEQQLERSVLEGKERDELSAIAQAMSLKTTSRTKKADIIDQILDATGVTSGSAAAGSSNGDAGHTVANGAKPTRRSRSATTAATETGDEADGTAMAATSDPGDGEADATTAAATAGGDTAPSQRCDGGGGRPRQLRTGGLRRAAGAGRRPGDPAPRQNGQNNARHDTTSRATGTASNQNNQNQNSQNNQNQQPASRRRCRQPAQPSPAGAASAAGQGGELQGGGQEQPYSGELVEVKGMLDLRDEGYGFLRCEGYLASPKDVYVSISQARRFALRRGDYVEGACRPASNNEKYPALLRIDSVSGLDPEEARNRPRFEDLTPLFPDSRLQPRDARRQGQPDGPHRRPALAHRQGPARHDRLAAEGGQDDGHEADRPFH